MSFLEPAVLFALPAALLPLVIHLLHRRRFRKKDWGAMQFLREALEEKRGQRKLKHWLLMALRMLAMACLIVAVSRPLIGGWLAGWVGGGEKRVTVLIDRSASMGRLDTRGLSKLQGALETLAQTCQALEPAELWLLDSAEGELRWLSDASALTDPPLLPTDTQANVPDLIHRALSQWESHPGPDGELWIVSDLQANDWRPQQAGAWADVESLYRRLEAPPRIRLLAMPGGQPNRSIACQAEGNQLSVTIRQDSEDTVTLPLALAINGQPTSHSLTLRQGLTEVRLDLPAQGALEGSVTLPDDGNPQDNRAYFVREPESRPAVTLVCENRSVGQLLRLAVNPWPTATVQETASVRLITPDQAAHETWERQTLVVWQGHFPDGATATALARWANEGGSLLFFPHTQRHNATNGTWEDIGFMRPTELDDPLSVSTWGEGEGPLRDTQGGEALPVDQWSTRRLAPLSNSGNGLPQASWPSGQTALLTLPMNEGAAHFCASLPLDDWSNLGEGIILLPLIQRLLEDGRRGRSPVRQVPPTAPTWLAGIESSEGQWTVAVRPPEEALSAELSGEALDTLFGDIPYQQFQMEEATGSDEATGNWWRIFLLAVLLCLLGENLLTRPPRQETALTTASPLS